MKRIDRLCKTCTWCKQHAGSLVCMRYPPIPFLIGNSVVSAHPGVHSEDYCSQYEYDGQDVMRKNLLAAQEGRKRI